MVTTSCDCHVTEDRSDRTAGAIVYQWDGAGREFPKDVIRLYIRMPVTWRDVCRLRKEDEIELDLEHADYPVDVGWQTDHVQATGMGARWQLSGTVDKPTLSPSLHWVGIWHGWLRNGRLESC